MTEKFKNEEIGSLKEKITKMEQMLKIVLDEGMGTLKEVEKRIKV